MSFLVQLDSKRCTCTEWQISGIPCRHAASAITHRRDNIEEYCHPNLKEDAYLRAYGGIIHPTLEQILWEAASGNPLDPPPLRRLLPGRQTNEN